MNPTKCVQWRGDRVVETLFSTANYSTNAAIFLNEGKLVSSSVAFNLKKHLMKYFCRGFFFSM